MAASPTRHNLLPTFLLDQIFCVINSRPPKTQPILDYLFVFEGQLAGCSFADDLETGVSIALNQQAQM